MEIMAASETLKVVAVTLLVLGGAAFLVFEPLFYAMLYGEPPDDADESGHA